MVTHYRHTRRNFSWTLKRCFICKESCKYHLEDNDLKLHWYRVYEHENREVLTLQGLVPKFCGNDDNLLPAHHMISDDKRHLKNVTLPVAVVRGEERLLVTG